MGQLVSLLAVLAFCLGSFWLLRKHTAGHTQQDSLRGQLDHYRKRNQQQQASGRMSPSKRHQQYLSSVAKKEAKPGVVTVPAHAMSSTEYNEL